MLNGVAGCVEEFVRIAIGFRQLSFDMDDDLTAVIEGRAELKLAAMLKSDAGAKEAEAGSDNVTVGGRFVGLSVLTMGADGSTGHDDAVAMLKQGAIEVRSDIHRGGADSDGRAKFSFADFDPINGLREMLGDEGIYFVGEPAALIGIGLNFGLVLFIVIGGGGKRAEMMGEFGEGKGQAVGEGVTGLHAAVAAIGFLGLIEGMDFAEELIGSLLNIVEEMDGKPVAIGNEDAAFGFGIIKAVEQIRDLMIGDANAEMLAGDGFDIVGFVKNDELIFRKDGSALHFGGEVREEQSMIGDDDVGAIEASSGFLIEAVAVVGAAFSGTGGAFAGD